MRLSTRPQPPLSSPSASRSGRRGWVPLLLTLTAAAALSAPAGAAAKATADTEPSATAKGGVTPPKALVEARYQEIQAAASQAADQAALKESLTTILGKLVDWDAFSQRTLTKSVWAELSASQRNTFRQAYEQLIVKKYANRFKPHATFRVVLRGDTELRANGTAAVVKTTVFTMDDGKEVGVDVDYDFVLVDGGKRWAVADIVTDGVSRARTYRPKFKRIYAKRGFKALIAAIEKNTKRR